MKTDKQLQRDVLDELQYEPSVDASKIGVIAHNGIVSLTGTVASYAEQNAATHAAERIAGVKAVANETKVELPSMHQRDDADIAQAVLNAFKWHVWVPQDAIKVSVERGWVTLEGTVNSKFQRTSADDAVTASSADVRWNLEFTVPSQCDPPPLYAHFDGVLRSPDVPLKCIQHCLSDVRVVSADAVKVALP